MFPFNVVLILRQNIQEDPLLEAQKIVTEEKLQHKFKVEKCGAAACTTVAPLNYFATPYI
jgi:hypothetical protein